MQKICLARKNSLSWARIKLDVEIGIAADAVRMDYSHSFEHCWHFRSNTNVFLNFQLCSDPRNKSWGVASFLFSPHVLVATRFPPAGLFSLSFLRSLASNVSKIESAWQSKWTQQLITYYSGLSNMGRPKHNEGRARGHRTLYNNESLSTQELV